MFVLVIWHALETIGCTHLSPPETWSLVIDQLFSWSHVNDHMCSPLVDSQSSWMISRHAIDQFLLWTGDYMSLINNPCMLHGIHDRPKIVSAEGANILYGHDVIIMPLILDNRSWWFDVLEHVVDGSHLPLEQHPAHLHRPHQPHFNLDNSIRFSCFGCRSLVLSFRRHHWCTITYQLILSLCLCIIGRDMDVRYHISGVRRAMGWGENKGSNSRFLVANRWLDFIERLPWHGSSMWMQTRQNV